MVKIKVSDIKVPPRVREDVGDIEGLKKSITELGLLYPIIIGEETKTLLDGERRLIAHKQLGIEEIPVIYLSSLPPDKQKMVELESNLKRKQFLWFEEVEAKLQLHELIVAREGKARKKIGGGWSIKNTADLLGEAPATFIYSIQLAEAVRKYPELKQAKNKATAFAQLKSFQEKLLTARAVQLMQEENLKKNPNASLQAYSLDLYCGDCLEIMPTLEKVDCIITDPPYAINLQDSSISKSHIASNMGLGFVYEDQPDKVFELLDKAVAIFPSILKPFGKGFFFFHIGHYIKIYKILSKHLPYVSPIPIVWGKINSAALGCYLFQHRYETAFYFSMQKKVLDRDPLLPQKGDLLLHSSIPSEKRIHPVEKPEGLIKDLIEAISSPTHIVLDPFCGSGVIPGIASRMGRKGIGIELNKDYYNAAMLKWKGSN